MCRVCASVCVCACVHASHSARSHPTRVYMYICGCVCMHVFLFNVCVCVGLLEYLTSRYVMAIRERNRATIKKKLSNYNKAVA